MTSPRLVGLSVLIAVVLSGCNASITFGQDVEAVGDLVSTTFEVDAFDSIDVSNAFDASIEVGEPQSVVVTVNASVVDELDIKVRNGELRIGLKNGISVNNGSLDAVIRVPALNEVSVSGASSTDVQGIDAASFDVEVSGASDLVLEGTAATVRVDGSGASNVDVRLDAVESAIIDLSGASSLELRSADLVTGDMSGASSMAAPASAELNVETSGASSISRR